MYACQAFSIFQGSMGSYSSATTEKEWKIGIMHDCWQKLLTFYELIFLLKDKQRYIQMNRKSDSSYILDDSP